MHRGLGTKRTCTRMSPSTRPAVFRPASTSMSVVLPAPEAPTSAVSTPGRNEPLTSCKQAGGYTV